ncbi:MAG: hypothetical protein KBD00_02470 [Candidatus Peribacteraceae bacterium]|nr:hypothetical protein [Candidatus Peribacteraceae bacterium]
MDRDEQKGSIVIHCMNNLDPKSMTIEDDTDLHVIFDEKEANNALAERLAVILKAQMRVVEALRHTCFLIMQTHKMKKND